MSFLIFAAPITFIIIFAIFVIVFASDSKRYRKNLDNSKQMELDNARSQALKAVEEMKRIKEAADKDSNALRNRQSSLSDQQVYEEDIYEQQVDSPSINKYQQYYNENYNRGKNKFSMQRNFDNTNVVQENSKKLEFTQENIVRGLIANEYLNKNSRRGR
ncbi:crotonobetainyl-CoA--carnitine CoA-transferase [Gemella haemolysans]|uniref:crotonobetainyl-CoA--carnitine CoA-transferase n=1 Tax=Gemella TaxID=1378 RepID=UPI00232E60E9|nr:crotonobetainyl-CoA--carnitine CoA-transferase [Gemella haemolysans]MDB6212860.1 crotonobetainyl-CoA--carnitine CoA-transferase [Gemella haemolysans]